MAHGAHSHHHVPSAGGEGEIEVPHSAHEHLNMRIAVTVALISTFMAGIHLSNEDTVIQMHHAEVSALDTWNQYQAKRMREYLSGMTADQLKVLAATAGAGNAKPFDDLQKRYQHDGAKYKDDEKELSEKAKGFEEQHEKLAVAHDRFDMSDGSIAVCLSVLAVTALTGKDWLLWVAWAFAGAGIAAGIWGLLSAHTGG